MAEKVSEPTRGGSVELVSTIHFCMVKNNRGGILPFGRGLTFAERRRHVGASHETHRRHRVRACRRARRLAPRATRAAPPGRANGTPAPWAGRTGSTPPGAC